MAISKNKQNSSILQALLDLQSVVSMQGHVEPIDPAFQEILESVIFTLQNPENYTLLMDADKKFHQHEYPETRITWSRRAKYSQSTAVFQISKTAHRLFDLLSMCCNRSNNVQASTSDLAKILGSNLNTVKRDLTELINNGLIAIVRPASFREGAIFMVNPSIDTCTPLDSISRHTRRLEKVFAELISQSALDNFSKINSVKNVSCKICTIDINNEQVTYSRLSICNPEDR